MRDRTKERLAYESRGLRYSWSTYSRRPWNLGAAMLHETDDRDFHRRYAYRHGLFWIPCPTCHRYFGGHEVGGSIETPEKGPGMRMGICTYCTLDGIGRTCVDNSAAEMSETPEK